MFKSVVNVAKGKSANSLSWQLSLVHLKLKCLFRLRLGSQKRFQKTQHEYKQSNFLRNVDRNVIDTYRQLNSFVLQERSVQLLLS